MSVNFPTTNDYTRHWRTASDLTAPLVYPYSFSGWVNVYDKTQNSTVLAMAEHGGTNNAVIFARDTPDNDLAFNISDGTNTDLIAAGGYTTGVWHHVAVICTNSISREIYQDAGTPGSSTSAVAFASVNNLSTGARYYNATVDLKATGNYTAELAVWNVALTTADVDNLASGVYPNQVSSANIVEYWPLLNDLNNAVSGSTVHMVDQGTSPLSSSIHPTMGNNNSIIVPRPLRSTKQLVTFAGDRIFWGPDSSNLTEITAAAATVDCTKPLTAVGGFGKVFVANETNLKVISFSDTLLKTADVGSSAVPTRSMELTGTSGAKMVVDFISDSTTSAFVYGYNVTTIAFASSDTITNSTNSVSFTLTSAANTGPHMYDWTPYGNDATTYGNMPSQSNLITRYRGRMIINCLSAPNNWYMTRVGNPFDFKYVVNDPLTPIAGNNGDAGELGDIPTAFIPQGDDYLVFGCAGSVQIMAGDPAFGGSIDELSDVTGMYGPQSWCKDESGNLYFYGTSGVYKMTGGRSKPENISVSKLPNLATTWNAVASVDQVVMTYDAERTGLLLSKTVLSTGANENYFFDLKLDAIFKEDYPANAGVYSSIQFRGKTLVGSYDGYLREFLDTAKSDDAGDTNAAITSYVGWVEVGTDTGHTDEGTKINSLTVDTAGGASSGGFTDADNVVLSIFVADHAELCMEDMIDGATAFLTVALVSVGRQPMIREPVRGNAIGFKFANATISESWAVNKVLGNIEMVGE